MQIVLYIHIYTYIYIHIYTYIYIYTCLTTCNYNYHQPIELIATMTFHSITGEMNNDSDSGDVVGRKILVSGLPDGTAKNSVHIHFQKKKNGGGEIERITLLNEGKALVLFEDPKGL